MFIGHYAVGFGAKKLAPEMSVGTLIFASLFLDVAWNILVFLNIEHFRVVPGITKVNSLDLYDFPYSHSLVFSLLWGCVLAVVYYALKRNTRNSIVVALCVFSHWILDFSVHKPDLALEPGSKLFFGLGLWNNYFGSISLEAALYLLGIDFYIQATHAKDQRGVIGFWSLAVFLPSLWILSFFSSPPSNARVIAVGGIFSVAITILWAWWADKHRFTGTPLHHT